MNDEEDRTERQICTKCYYANNFSGQAFTEWECKSCHEKGLHRNTATPVLCVDCAKKEGLCIECGRALTNK